MALTQKIPLIAETTDQRLTIELGGNPYLMRVLWNERFEYFSLSLNTLADEPILANVKMVKNFPLIGRFKDTRLPFGDLYFVQEKGNAPRPVYSDLGVNCNLFYFEQDPEPAVQFVRELVSEPVIGTIWDSQLTTWDTGDTLWDQ